MYLKKLELVGFKSFFNKTVLNFEPGITAVVGPNGCGKSNIFDSMRWVLGEQSIKSLRGSDMQDVIFNGTDSKEPLGMAEVSLTFDNTNRFFNIDHPEMMITRRIFRSGESEYLLNKNQVRLKDILDLLMGTGIGAESYSLVAQGQIDLVLSSRPEDRRLVFDEASGITKYKTQKREAVRKLEETEANLLRINDIVAEVKRQIGHLERQANKARKYKEVFEELKSKEIALAILQKLKLLKEKDELIKELSGLESKEIKLMEAIQEQEARIYHRQTELRTLQDNVMGFKNEILNLDNQVFRNQQSITLNQERIKELEASKQYLEVQIGQVKNKLLINEEKLNQHREEHAGLQKNIDEKSAMLNEKEKELNNLTASIKASLENIAQAKKEILALVTQVTNIKNEISDSTGKQQIYLARQKRLHIEKAKVLQEKSISQDDLRNITQELENLSKIFADSTLRVSDLKNESEKEAASLSNINSDIEQLERQRLTLESHRDFIEKLKTRLQDIGESMNAVVYLDKLPAEKVDGLVIKIKEHVNLSDEDKAYLEPAAFKLSGEAKPIDLDTQKISQKIAQMQLGLDTLKNTRITKEARLGELNKLIAQLQQELHNQEINLANKKSVYATALEQFNKIKEEEEIIELELKDVERELSVLEVKLNEHKTSQSGLDQRHKQTEEAIACEENNINSSNHAKEKVLVEVAQTKTELTALMKRIDSDKVTLKILEDTYQQDKDSLSNIEKQIHEAEGKREALILETKDFENKINGAIELIQSKKSLLREKEGQYSQITATASDVATEIDSDRKALDALKNKLYQLQMQNKDIDYKYASIKERILQNYKVVLETAEGIPEEIDEQVFLPEIEELKKKIDSYGSVNLVAIEEYDELKQRYDFLTQQQTDLVTAKESLHEAILKINRTTKKMFLETFELVRQEFRNYFRLLFNGGDAQVFLIDEGDPLESGIEIICRPPGKKLQNVLLLSGGEKALSAIALIFAIFKVKPSPFCVLDEIDAALDEANVDRFSRLLQEFAQQSQFIVITHNKKTIANADVMYGITMEESGVSKIVSVRFAKNKPLEDKEPDMAMA